MATSVLSGGTGHDHQSTTVAVDLRPQLIRAALPEYCLSRKGMEWNKPETAQRTTTHLITVRSKVLHDYVVISYLDRTRDCRSRQRCCKLFQGLDLGHFLFSLRIACLRHNGDNFPFRAILIARRIGAGLESGGFIMRNILAGVSKSASTTDYSSVLPAPWPH